MLSDAMGNDTFHLGCTGRAILQPQAISLLRAMCFFEPTDIRERWLCEIGAHSSFRLFHSTNFKLAIVHNISTFPTGLDHIPFALIYTLVVEICNVTCQKTLKR